MYLFTRYEPYTKPLYIMQKKLPFISILILILLFSCKTKTEHSNFYEITLTEKTVIGISPDSTEIEKMKLRLGDDFYTIADDVMYYRSQTFSVIDSLKIKYIHTDKKLIRFITKNEIVEFNADSSKIKWRYFYYNGKKLKETDVFEIINMYEFYE